MSIFDWSKRWPHDRLRHVPPPTPKEACREIVLGSHVALNLMDDPPPDAMTVERETNELLALWEEPFRIPSPEEIDKAVAEFEAELTTD